MADCDALFRGRDPRVSAAYTVLFKSMRPVPAGAQLYICLHIWKMRICMGGLLETSLCGCAVFLLFSIKFIFRQAPSAFLRTESNDFLWCRFLSPMRNFSPYRTDMLVRIASAGCQRAADIPSHSFCAGSVPLCNFRIDLLHLFHLFHLRRRGFPNLHLRVHHSMDALSILVELHTKHAKMHFQACFCANEGV